MTRQIATALCAAVLGLVASSPFAIAQRNGDRPIYSSIQELMDSIVDSSADVIWGAAGTIVDKDAGVVEMSPKTEAEWRDVRRAAVRIVEGANLLMMPGRDAAPPGTKSETPGVELEPAEMTALIDRNRASFDSLALALQLVGLEALQAIDAKNVDSLLDIGARMEDVCESCHRTFWYPGEKVP